MSNNFYINYRALADGYNWKPDKINIVDKEKDSKLADGLSKEEMAAIDGAIDGKKDGILTEKEFLKKYGDKYQTTWNSFTPKDNFAKNIDTSSNLSQVWHSLEKGKSTNTYLKANGTINHYVNTTTDKNGKATKEEYFDEAGVLLQTTTYEYNASGDVSKAITTNGSGVTTLYQYLDAKGYNCAVTFDEATGKPTAFVKTDSSGKEIYKEEYIYDNYHEDKTKVNIYNNGELASEVNYDDGTIQTKKEFNDDGKVVSYCYTSNQNGTAPQVSIYNGSVLERNVEKRYVDYYMTALEIKPNGQTGPVYNEMGDEIKIKRYKNKEEYEKDKKNLAAKYPDMCTIIERGEIPFIEDMEKDAWEAFPDTMYNSFYNFTNTHVKDKVDGMPITTNNNDILNVAKANITKAENITKINKDYKLDDYNILETLSVYDNHIEDIKKQMSETTNEGEIAALQVELYFAYQNMSTQTKGLDLTSAISKFTNNNKELIRKEKNDSVKKELEKLNELLESYPDNATLAEINAQAQKVQNAKLAIM